ncbi:hypothetical protein ACO22_02945 [Paracoccidioides brasiliensis]|uniref:Uncharacterized protein n=1 Tax=Paracoccidioides brasiliensis TaxID=121759 RepID=A0A1D2JHB0_PARBR|nr:hypothetical protein ACO22_02945 [Paracoccidioides brasiliensis]ODH49274.1 hypothetical protein GX48_04614 [Paracoccidioides brasiliensis]
MGAGGSKPAAAGTASRHIFSSDTPVQFSQAFVESLQGSPETDSTRAQTLELHIQNRIAAELERIRARESQTLADLEKRLAEDSSSPSASPASTNTDGTPVQELSSARVRQEISSLSAKLAERRKVRELDEGVEKARGDLVRCLKGNKRRPLDCWREVEGFKREVGRLEKKWVESVVG